MSEPLILKEITVGAGTILRSTLQHGEVTFSLHQDKAVVSQSLNPTAALTLVMMAIKPRQ